MFESSALAAKMAQAAYSMDPPKQIGPFRLLQNDPTLKFYVSGNNIIISVRGTKKTEAKDYQTWGLIPLGQLSKSQRYKDDEKIIKRFEAINPRHNFYAVGHSLGSAIIDLLLTKGLIKSAITFNGAIEPHYIRYKNANHRIYNERDPLYALMGQFSINPEVRKNIPTEWWETIVSGFPVANNVVEIYKRLQAHRVENITNTNV